MKKKVFTLTCIILALVFLAFNLPFTSPARAEYNYGVNVFVDSKEVNFPDQKPFIDSQVERTYVPLRFVSEALGGEAGWDQAKQTASVNKSGATVLMKIGSRTPTVNGQSKPIDAAAILLNDRTVVPLRFVSECLGATVEWVEATRTVKITTKAKNTESRPGYKYISGFWVPETTDLDIEGAGGDVLISIGIVLTIGDVEKQYLQAREILADKFGGSVADEAISYAKSRIGKDNLDRKVIKVGENGAVTVDASWNTPFTYIQVWNRWLM